MLTRGWSPAQSVILSSISLCMNQYRTTYHCSTEPYYSFRMFSGQSKGLYVLSTHKCLEVSHRHLNDERPFKKAVVLLQWELNSRHVFSCEWRYILTSVLKLSLFLYTNWLSLRMLVVNDLCSSLVLKLERRKDITTDRAIEAIHVCQSHKQSVIYENVSVC